MYMYVPIYYRVLSRLEGYTFSPKHLSHPPIFNKKVSDNSNNVANDHYYSKQKAIIVTYLYSLLIGRDTLS